MRSEEDGDDDRREVVDHAEPGEQIERRAEDFVERPRVSARAILGDEFDNGAGVAEVEHRRSTR